MAPDEIRLAILKLLAAYENSSAKRIFDAQRAADVIGLDLKVVHRYLDMLADERCVIPHKSHTSYGVQMAPGGWRLLEQEEARTTAAPTPTRNVPVAHGPYEFHRVIEEVSGAVYRDGHFREAALNAYIRVIEEVRKRSGLDLDGDPLMNRAFACDKHTPVIQINALREKYDLDEQRGFMNLFKGIVGLRNLKAHTTTALLDDPNRAHEYLAMASLLLRVLDISTVDRA
jgi:uncharacterized protein (TIGR02391 family)